MLCIKWYFCLESDYVCSTDDQNVILWLSIRMWYISLYTSIYLCELLYTQYDI